MESKWRLNPWLIGRAYGTTRLAARVLTITDRTVYLGQIDPPVAGLAQLWDVDEQGYAFISLPVNVNPNLRFPYGFTVEPDSPT